MAMVVMIAGLGVVATATMGKAVAGGQTAGRAICLLVHPRIAMAQHIFADRAALLVACDAWCSNPQVASATYGPIGGWHVYRVTDMDRLFCASHYNRTESSACNAACASFNEDLSNWNTSRVTNMEVRWRVLSDAELVILCDWSYVV